MWSCRARINLTVLHYVEKLFYLTVRCMVVTRMSRLGTGACVVYTHPVSLTHIHKQYNLSINTHKQLQPSHKTITLNIDQLVPAVAARQNITDNAQLSTQ